MSLNTVTLVGRAGKDPELRYFESGKVVCNFTMAVNRRRKGEDQPDWFDLEIWGRTAEIAGEYVRKGSLIGVTGSLKFDRWKDRQSGEDRQKPVISVERLDLLGSRQDRESAMPDPETF
ncbi:MAG: single-stranded DNA-binding protein [Cyanobacteriota bacterium]|nr:single-stranded DNA-binding protein [Cyanobacteriota bacterium]